MSEEQSTNCPRCGHPATGNFCAHCGAAITQTACASCGAAMEPDAQFCHRCGAPRASGASAFERPRAPAAPDTTANQPVSAAARSRETKAWLVAAVLVLITIVAVVYAATKRTNPEIPSMANAGNADGAVTGAPATTRAPNIDSLSPRERFVRLEARVDQMLQQNDTAQVAFFMQMAVNAWQMLPPADRDIDLRFHAAMLEAQLGMFPAARAMADTIATQAPNNLLADYLRAIVAGFAGDSTAAQAARAAFRAHYDTEIRKTRPEYREHLTLLQQYRQGEGAR